MLYRQQLTLETLASYSELLDWALKNNLPFCDIGRHGERIGRLREYIKEELRHGAAKKEAQTQRLGPSQCKSPREISPTNGESG